VGKIEAPTLLLWTDHDPTGGLDEARMLRSWIADTRLHVIADSGHWPQWEHPREFVEQHRTFLVDSAAHVANEGDHVMRATVTLDPYTKQLIRARTAERGVSFDQALNDLLREVTPGRQATPFATQPAALGVPAVNPDRASQLAADLEDEDLMRWTRPAHERSSMQTGP